jgi:hypothetical protein
MEILRHSELVFLYVTMRNSKGISRLRLADKINSLGVMVFPCSRCQQSGSECRVLPNSTKCGSCTRLGRPCNVREVTDLQFDKIDREKERLDAEILKAQEEEEKLSNEALVRRAKWRRLLKQKKFLKEREIELVRRGLSNVEELERVEEEEREAQEAVNTTPVPSDLDFNFEDPLAGASDEQISAFFASLPAVAETSEEVPHSSAVSFPLVPTCFLSPGSFST